MFTFLSVMFEEKGFDLALANNISLCVFQVTEMEAILLQHHTAMPSRQVLEDIAEKFRCSVLLHPSSFIII